MWLQGEVWHSCSCPNPAGCLHPNRGCGWEQAHRLRARSLHAANVSGELCSRHCVPVTPRQGHRGGVSQVGVNWCLLLWRGGRDGGEGVQGTGSSGCASLRGRGGGTGGLWCLGCLGSVVWTPCLKTGSEKCSFSFGASPAHPGQCLVLPAPAGRAGSRLHVLLELCVSPTSHAQFQDPRSGQTPPRAWWVPVQAARG